MFHFMREHWEKYCYRVTVKGSKRQKTYLPSQTAFLFCTTLFPHQGRIRRIWLLALPGGHRWWSDKTTHRTLRWCGINFFPPSAPVIGSAIHPDFTPTCIHYACIVIKWSHNARPVVELMHPHSPRCKCRLIILLSSSNKAVGEINAHDKRRWEGVELVRGRLAAAAADAQPLTEEAKGMKREEGREGASERGSHGGMNAPKGRMWSCTRNLQMFLTSGENIWSYSWRYFIAIHSREHFTQRWLWIKDSWCFCHCINYLQFFALLWLHYMSEGTTRAHCLRLTFN